jgi:serine/threonine protein kinase
MPSPTTIDEFLELVRKSEVVEEKKLTAYLDKMRAAQALPSTPAALAGLLVRDGVLTRFQAEQFLQGKWRRFCLGKYKVLEKLGAGGMGIVYLCEHKLMRRRVAVKVLPESGAEDTSALERFYREARAVAALDHPNIVRAYDIDQDDKLHFLVMEYVDGSSLQEIVKKTGPMDVLRACHYIRQAALGLQHAHDAAGIVHRDIKPGNILVDRNGIVKVLDMGLARFFHDKEDALTEKYNDDVLGTADYLAPEQALDSHAVDIRADIYSLGATFYFCLTGRTPFTDGTIAQKLIWHQTRQPKPIRQLRPEVPEGVAAIVEKMMAKDPKQRPQTPLEVAEMLTPWTQTPIPPPPEHEMPQFSPAAMGSVPGDTGPLGGPKTPNSGADLARTPRKVWHVAQSATPAPPTATPAKHLPKTDPPRGTLNLDLSPARCAHAEHGNQGEKATTPQGPSISAAFAASPSSPPETQDEPIVVHESASAAISPPILSPSNSNLGEGNEEKSVRPLLGSEQAPSWAELLESENAAAAANQTTPRAVWRDSLSASQRVAGLPSLAPPRKHAWILGVSSAIGIGLLSVCWLLSWLCTDAANLATPAVPPPAVFYVNPHGGDKATTSIAEILNHLRGKTKQAARIIVEDDIAESDIVLDVPHLILEAEEGKTIRWRPAAKPGTTKLFAVYKAEAVCVKGFTLDGENRVDFLVNLFHRCPGAKLENLKLQGFTKYGVWVTNCEGSLDRPIEFNRLEFITTRREQAALFFSIEPGIRNIIPKDRYFAFHACTFLGDGMAVKTPDPATLEDIAWPPNVRPVQGR